MKIGILGCIDYPNLKTVQNFISYLQLTHRPFGNMDDEYEEPIEILSRLHNHLDTTAAIEAAKVNFKVRHMDSMDALIEESNEIYVFLSGNKCKTSKYINKILSARKNFRVIFSEERTH